MQKGFIAVVTVVFIFWGIFSQARHIRQMSSMIQEQFVDGVEFAHTIKSDQGKIEEKFMIDGSIVLKDEYYKQLETAQLKDLRKDRERLDRKARSKLAFADQAHALVLEKLAMKLLQDVAQGIDRLQQGNLQQFYVFKEDGVQSLGALSEMKHFINQMIKHDLRLLVEDHNLVGLQELIDKIDAWPERLDNCFKDTVHNAIRHSDDTAALKELLAMVAGEVS